MVKKFLYTDNESLKSVAAQLYEGILLEHDITEGESNNEGITDNFGTSEGSGTKYAARVRAILGADVEGLENTTSQESKSVTEGESQIFQESKKIAQDEYLFNIVQESLQEEKVLKNKSNANQYDYISFNDDFYFFDFNVFRLSK